MGTQMEARAKAGGKGSKTLDVLLVGDVILVEGLPIMRMLGKAKRINIRPIHLPYGRFSYQWCDCGDRPSHRPGLCYVGRF